MNVLLSLALLCLPGSSLPVPVRTDGLVLEARPGDGGVDLRLSDPSGIEYVRGPVRYELKPANAAPLSLTARIASADADALVVEAAGADIELRHEIRRSTDPAGLIERIGVRYTGREPLEVEDYRFGLRRDRDAAGDLRAVAVPFRRQADGLLRDWSLAEIQVGRAGNSDWRNEPVVLAPAVVDSALGRLRSEGWILTDGRRGLLVAKYNQEDIEYAMLDWTDGDRPGLTIGGSAFALYREPESMQRLSPGARVELGVTYYLPFEGGWPAGYERFRMLLNGLGHGLADGYDPPLNWNELFDIGWWHSDPVKLAEHYTRAALMNEAAKAAEIGATLLYLDPGWEVCEGTTLWAEDRLGTVAGLVAELHERFGLALGFRTIGRVYRDEFPGDWYMRRPPGTQPYERPPAPTSIVEPVPDTDERGCRNLALLPEARAGASGVLPDSHLHRIANLNDGAYGNAASWVSDGEPSWASIDLGADYRIDRVRLGSEHTPVFRDRAARHLRVQVARDPGSGEPAWETVVEHRGEPVRQTRTFSFAPRTARLVRIEILESEIGSARLDEIEVYEAQPQPWTAAPVRRRVESAESSERLGFWEVCTLHPAWQKEKSQRIARIVSQGMTFAMFDEFDWRGPCHCPDHGHPVPSTAEAHVRAVYGLIREARRHAPGLLVEAHDPVWPWSVRYLPIYFDQTPDPARRPGAYEENWGFEFMWNPIEDLISGRALCLYYYNLGCEIPLYDHITMEGDNDACLAFWWYASTVRHLGIGGKKGLNSAAENPVRWEAWKRAMRQYLAWRDWFVRGRFVGLDEMTHLHVLPGRPGGVLVAFNLEASPVQREVTLDPGLLGMEAAARPRVTGAAGRSDAGGLHLDLRIEPRSPLVVEITR